MSSLFEPVPTEVRGVKYPSMKAAAEAIGVYWTTIQQAMNKGTLDRVGLNPRGRRMSKPVNINGVDYPSIRQATYHIDISFSRLQRLVAKRGTTLTLTQEDLR